MGRDVLLEQKTNGVPKKLSAIRVQEKSPPIRAHYAILQTERKLAKPPVAHCRLASAVALR